MSTVDSYSFISAFTIGRDFTALFNHKQDDPTILHHTRWGLVITLVFSILLAMYFEYAVDIWYVIGSFIVPALLLPLISALYQIKLRNPSCVILLPAVISIFWYLYGMAHLTVDGYPEFIWGLDPMYPGVLVSLILFSWNRD